jgi:hypothetical protein
MNIKSSKKRIFLYVFVVVLLKMTGTNMRQLFPHVHQAACGELPWDQMPPLRDFFLEGGRVTPQRYLFFYLHLTILARKKYNSK